MEEEGGREGGGEEGRQERKISSWLRLTIANSSFPLGREGAAGRRGQAAAEENILRQSR